jgi:hypothetical protein
VTRDKPASLPFRAGSRGHRLGARLLAALRDEPGWLSARDLSERTGESAVYDLLSLLARRGLVSRRRERRRVVERPHGRVPFVCELNVYVYRLPPRSQPS